MNPVNGLLNSRKFWVAMFDLVVSLVLYFGGKYADPSVAEDMIFLIGAIQPVFLLVIGGIAYEDGKAKAAGAHPSQFYQKPRLDVPESDNME